MKFTIFTPTYNRCKLIGRIYTYLVSENYKDLEWLIVDDGSTDATRTYIEDICLKSGNINIRYFYQKNAGKYVAFNKAIDEAKGEYFICLDSDDLYVKGAFRKLEKIAQDLTNTEAGICYLSSTEDGNIIGSTLPPKVKSCDLIELYYKYGVTGDKGILHRTNILKKYRFPLFPGEKFATETILYSQICEKYTYRLVNEVFEIKEYQENGLTDKYRELIKKNPCSSLCNYQLVDKHEMNIKMTIRNTVRYLSFVFYLKSGWRQNFHKCNHKLFYVLLTPAGYIVGSRY